MGLVEGPARGEPLDVVRNPPGAGLRTGDVVQAVQERVASRAGERGEERLRLRGGIEGALEVGGDRRLARGGVRGVPAAVGLRGIDGGLAGRAQAPLGAQPLDVAAVDLRPLAPARPGVKRWR